MSMEVTTAGQPGAPRCSEAATGQEAELRHQLTILRDDLWSVHTLLRATSHWITEWEVRGTDGNAIGEEAAEDLRRMLSLATDKLSDLALSGRAQERVQ